MLFHDRSTEENEEFWNYILNLTKDFTIYLIYTSILLILITWPSDYFYEKPSIQKAYFYWRVIGLTGMLGFEVIRYLIDDEAGYVFLMISLSSSAYIYVTAFIFGSVTTMMEPWFSVIYVIPVMPVVLPVGLLSRIFISHAVAILYFLGFLAHRPLSEFGYPIMQTLTIISVCWFSIIMGHSFLIILRRNFFQNIELEQERQKSETLLTNILPEEVSERLKAGEDVSEKFDNVTVLFADIVEFTPIADHFEADEVVSILDEMFSSFDDLVNKYDLEKIKTIGDEYFVAAGVPEAIDKPALRMANLAIDMKDEVRNHQRHDGSPFRLRCGMNTGPLVAGIIGKEKFVYDVWGDTVNIGSRMESQGEPGKIQVTPATKQAIEEQNEDGEFEFEERGTIEVKGKGEMTSYFLNRS